MTSMRAHLTRNVLVAVLLLLLVGSVALCATAYDGAVNLFDDMLEARAESIAALTIRKDGRVRVELSDSIRRSFAGKGSQDYNYFQLWDADGRVVARSTSLDDDERLPLRTGRTDDPKKWNFKLPNGRPGRALGIRFRPEDSSGRGGEIQLVVAADREDLNEALGRMIGLALGMSGLLAGVTIWVVPRVLRRRLRPLERLGEQAAAIDAGSLAMRFSTRGLPSELGPIAVRLNELLERLEQSFERERRFSADLAHELRTPLTELRSMAETALRWPDQRDPRTDRDVLAISLQLERIVANILALARGEEGELRIQAEAVPVHRMLQDVWSHFAGRATERGIRVESELEPVEVAADPALLRAILVNLVENAVDYSPAGGTILLATVRREDRAIVTVANAAPDLGAGDIPHLFERFWRKEAARSGGVHVGLGLSLARGFAEAMGWALAASREASGLLTVTLSGPGVDKTGLR